MNRSIIPAVAAPLALTAVVLAQSPTFSSRVEVVRLDVLASEDGTPIRGLTAADFEVRDNGVLQTVSHAGFEQVPLGLVLTLDVSASVSGDRLDQLREAGRAILTSLKKDDEASLITFTHAITQDAKLTTRIEEVKAALEEVDPDGDTALVDGIYAGVTTADATSGRGLVIAFSDGSDTASWLTETAVIDAARRSDVVVYGVASGVRDPSFLRDITRATGGRLYEVESTKDLRAVFLSALEEFRQRYLLSYSPQGVNKGGWHRIEVKVKGRRANVRARPGYLAGP